MPNAALGEWRWFGCYSDQHWQADLGIESYSIVVSVNFAPSMSRSQYQVGHLRHLGNKE